MKLNENRSKGSGDMKQKRKGKSHDFIVFLSLSLVVSWVRCGA